jgi:hypothetical protein
VADGDDMQVMLSNHLEPLAAAGNNDFGIRYIHLDNRLTIGAKRNFCCERARGSIICHWDDDDWSCGSRISEQVQALRESGAAVHGYYSLVFEDETGKRFHWASPTRTPCGSSLAYLKSWWRANQFKALQVCEDGDFVERAAGRMISDAAMGAMTASIHPGNTSQRNLLLDMYKPL